jgi:transcriptional regulator with XRE-family HTH domain
MDFTEKLRRLGQEVNKAKAAESVGLAATTISNYIAKGSTPRADIALKIARALQVPLEWLVDDAQGWPPPKSSNNGSHAGLLTDGELIGELLHRRRLAQLDLLEKLERAERVNWSDLHRRLVAVPPEGPIPRDLVADVSLVFSLFVSYARFFKQFDLAFHERVHGGALPTGGRKHEDLDQSNLVARVDRVMGDSHFQAVSKDASKRPDTATANDRLDVAAWVSLLRVSTGEISLESVEREWGVSRKKKATP